MSIDLGQVSHDLGLPLEKIQRAVALLDDGNTVPFITRYRKDHTGGLDEEQIRAIQENVTKARLLAERKSTILKSIEVQGKLTPELAEQIKSARNTKRLEDLYLPFKPKKQTLATLARQRGLEPLAREVYEADSTSVDLAARAMEFIRVDRELPTIEDVMQGVGHLISERFGDRAELRGRLRRILWRTGKLVCVGIVPNENAARAAHHAEAEAELTAQTEQPRSNTRVTPSDDATSHVEPIEPAPTTTLVEPAENQSIVEPPSGSQSETEPPAELPLAVELAPGLDFSAEQSPSVEPPPTELETTADETSGDVAETLINTPQIESASSEESALVPVVVGDTSQPAAPDQGKKSPPPAPSKAARRKAKKAKQQKSDSAFQDYFNFQESLNHIPPHRILAINRGERAKALRVRIDADDEAIYREAEQLLIPPDHPHIEFLRGCLRDALSRLVLPTLEREIRRELTEQAERHAVDVFARNLRALLLQPQVRGRRVLAVDPGYRSGCKYAALDEFGNILGHGHFHIVGNQQRREKGRRELAEVILRHHLTVLAIGNGTACRDAEQMAADLIANELKGGPDVAYVVVNEAGASVYSTSTLGREELPGYDPIVRGAVSIGRRLLDPLSELVKINPANIGVGMYQHDVKAKHLSESLDAVVESCVNYVGVDVNTASPALLRYVSGLNQLTARRLYEHRQMHGPFRRREQFKEVAGFGDATFIQSAGFLKISGGDNPLDATWIHPESYEVANRVLEKLDSTVDDLASFVAVHRVAAQPVASPPVIANDPATLPNGEAPPTLPFSQDESPGPATADSLPETVPEIATADSVAAEAATSPPAPRTPPSQTTANGSITTTVAKLVERVRHVNAAEVARELNVGELLLNDILRAIARPGRDPRDDLPSPVFRRGIMKLEDLQTGMELTGTVLNVVDFGAFVDIGLSDSGLVHISRLADRYVADPHEVVGVGDVLRVWVLDVDRQRRRVSLTAIQPGSEKPHARRSVAESPQPKPAGERPPRARQRPARGDKPQPAARPAKAAKQRPPQRPKPPPKPVKPITKGMVEGKEPMRSFSDLIQFFEKKKDGPEDTDPKE